jgi:NAD(P)-dependent dehydrogenase (short-subunit alcohol dehydrogenase family)
MSNLKDKVALVSGSGRGIGRAIAHKLARHGAKVVVNDLDEEPGRAVADEIKSAGGQAIAVNGSVTDAGFSDRFVGAAMETFGGLDIIVNNAGLHLGLDHSENDRRTVPGDARRAPRGAVSHSARRRRSDPHHVEEGSGGR